MPDTTTRSLDERIIALEEAMAKLHEQVADLEARLATEMRTQRLVVEKVHGRELLTAGEFDSGHGFRLSLHGPGGESVDLFMNEDDSPPFMGVSTWAKGEQITCLDAGPWGA